MRRFTDSLWLQQRWLDRTASGAGQVGDCLHRVGLTWRLCCKTARKLFQTWYAWQLVCACSKAWSKRLEDAKSMLASLQLLQLVGWLSMNGLQDKFP
mmetsp:Transcript_25202/g.40778  ORF Transcript_25202/g.40778 Transcript_25202/m.40778 type:complete len:97 (-) Transcript_25202:2581-2871(-)